MLLAIALLLAAAAPAPSRAASSAQAAQRSFSVAAGPLAHVIAQYANQAGVALSFDAAQLGRRQSPGLQGRYAVDDGFARLLQGTALQAVHESRGVYTLRPLPAAALGTSGQTLGTVTVRPRRRPVQRPKPRTAMPPAWSRATRGFSRCATSRSP
ncbi:STN domain-containing protein [Delftia tsuruhatensis]